MFILIAFAAQEAVSQTTKWREIHKVKRKETIFGIAKDFNLTVEELLDANPEMKQPGYELKKGEYIFIPFSTRRQPSTIPAEKTNKETTATKTTQTRRIDLRDREIRVGVMLPLHNINGDGKRMVEYYRGVLMACDSLRKEGISIDIHAWNVPEDEDINRTLNDRNAAKCDLIIGPLYSIQVKALADFAAKHDIKVLIPFSINAPELYTNSNIFQVYQNSKDYNESVIRNFTERFAGYNTVIIDCNDSTSRKGEFTAPLRKRLESLGRTYNITNLKSSEGMFAKAFSTSKPNVVVLNTGRSPELNVAFAKINNLTANHPKLNVTMFGYTEWMMYTKYQLDNFYKYNTHIPGTFYMNPLSSQTERIQLKYRWNFHADMMQALPRFAITGFDHAYYFIKGMKMYGNSFTGAHGTVGYTPIQTPLHFERATGNGGFRNTSMLFVRYTPEHRIETIYY
ncbi:PBP1 and LysM peptidoglycan-binding domain-containing protein [Xylanibacter muris]|nr:LysM peptidoglycan-binding domain-containing protein [Xylanibacter muris]